MLERKTPKYPYGFAAVLIGVYALLAIPPLLILPGAIGWPDTIQGMPATEALPVIRDAIGTFRLGYTILVLDALLLLPAAFFVVRAMAGGERPGMLLQLAYGFAVASAALRSLWWAVGLTVYPVLDNLLTSPETGAAGREAADVTYIVINEVFSTVAEDIGVNIFGALFTILVSAAILAGRGFPRWLGVWGILGGLLLISSSAELLGFRSGAVIPVLAPTITQLWFLALGVTIWLKRPRAARQTPSNDARPLANTKGATR